MNMTELTDIPGVGPSYAEDLEESGYESVSDVSEADPEEIGEIIERKNGEDVVEDAADLLGEETDSEEEEAVDVEEESVVEGFDDVEEEEDDDTEEDDDDLVRIDSNFTPVQENYFIGALVDQEKSARRSNNTDVVDIVNDAIEEVKAGEPYEFTEEQLNHAYTAVNQLEQSIRADRNLTAFAGQVREIRQVIQDERRNA